MTSDLTLTSFDCVPEHMEQLGKIAKSLGLTRAALLRLIIARYVRRAR
jgi:predicted DNA-binding protein